MKTKSRLLIVLLALMLAVTPFISCEQETPVTPPPETDVPATPDEPAVPETPDTPVAPDNPEGPASPEDGNVTWPGYPTEAPAEPSIVGDLILTRVVHADNNRKYVEITNIGSEPVDLSPYAFYTLKNGDHSGDWNANEGVSAVIPLPSAKLAPGCSVYIKHQWKTYPNDMSDFLSNIDAIPEYTEGTAEIMSPVLIKGALQYNGKDTVELIKDYEFNDDHTVRSRTTVDYLYDDGSLTGSTDTFFVKQASYWRVFDKVAHTATWMAMPKSQQAPEFDQTFNTVPESR